MVLSWVLLENLLLVFTLESFMNLFSPFFTADLMLLGRIASQVQDKKSGQTGMLGRTQKHGKNVRKKTGTWKRKVYSPFKMGWKYHRPR